jgi:murein tripeptide amidase MpaA
VRVHLEDKEDVERLQQLVVDLELDPWTEFHENHFADVFVPPEALNTIEKILQNENFTVLIDDMQRHIDKERSEHDSTQDFNFLESNEGMDSSFHRRFHRFEEIEDWLMLKAEKNPRLATFIDDIGRSVDGKKIFVLKITTPASEGAEQKPIVLINSLFHAREWYAIPSHSILAGSDNILIIRRRISGATSLYMIDRFLDLADEDSRIKDLLDRFEWHFIPVANPDGYHISWSKDRLWRSNKLRFPT